MQGPAIVRGRCWKSVALAVARRKASTKISSFSSTINIFVSIKLIQNFSDVEKQLEISNKLSSASLELNLNKFTDYECLSYFLFRKKDIGKAISEVSWPTAKTFTARNRYFVSPVLETFVLLRILASPACWRVIEDLFGNHAPKLS